MAALRVGIESTPLLDLPTGIGSFVRQLIDRLAREPDLDIVAFAYTRAFLDELRAELPPGVSSTKRAVPRRPLLWTWARAGRPRIEHWTGPVDVVHGTNFVVPPARAARLVSVHDLTCVRSPELCDAQTLRYPPLIRRAVDTGAHVHTGSHFVASEIQATFDVEPARVHVIPYGLAPTSGGEATRGRSLAGAERYVLFIGTVEPRKDLPTLVRAFDAVGVEADLRLVVAGRDGWGSEAFEAALRSARNRDRVVRLGFVDDRDRADLLAGATALAFPSLYEGFGLPPLEAMSASVPVVATSAGAVPEVVGEAALLVEPRDVDGLAEALVLATTDLSTRSTLVTAGIERVRAFSWERTAAEMVALYRVLASAREPGRRPSRRP